jgi:hypothetical protein
MTGAMVSDGVADVRSRQAVPLGDLSHRESGVTQSDEGRVALRIDLLPTSALDLHVPCVLRLRSEPEVRRVHAASLVASVHDHPPVVTGSRWDGAVDPLVSVAVGPERPLCSPPADVETPIAASVEAACPEPALAGPVDVGVEEGFNLGFMHRGSLPYDCMTVNRHN